MLENRHIGKGDAYLFGAEPDIPDTDGLITDIPGVALLVKQADCQAITMFDPVHGVIANIHCGWRGNVKGIISNAVEYMCKNRGSAASDIWASISPAIGVCCMEFDGWRTLLPQHMHRFVANDHCDFRAVSRSQLEACGIPPAHVHCSETCTCCSDDFFSYRREKVTGRCGTVIVMHDNTTGERQGKRYG
jgi:YfiH family protein